MDSVAYLDLDEEVVKKKTHPLGWFVSGVLVLALAVALGGYYRPLNQAHSKLIIAQERLARKSQELDYSLRKTTQSLIVTESSRASLQKFVHEGTTTENAYKRQVETAGATAANLLKPYVKAKLVRFKELRAGIQVSFNSALLFRGAKPDISTRARLPVCKTTQLLTKKNNWTITVTTRARATDEDYWQIAAARGAHLADLLIRSCKIEPERILITSDRTDDSDISGYTDLLLGPLTPPRLSPQDAPITKAEK